MTDEFWKRKSLAEMSGEEWESLCDGCALCCLQKLEDNTLDETYFTNIACKLLDTDACRCTNYANRTKLVSSCLALSLDSPEAFRWLPATCAYLLLADGEDLPDWHPLNTGDPNSVHETGISAKGKCVSETKTTKYSLVRRLS
ncbi:MAG: YcgN family cysteine cluster protein [Pseudomonadota bacterium]|nr:YcgN family cysteine cluster protein [Pseudomonadota bacterium]